MQNQEKIAGLKKRIGKTLFRERALLFAAGIAGTITGLVLVSIILSLIAGILILPVWLKVTLLGMSATGLIYLFWRFSFSRLFSGNLETTAIKLEKKFPELKGRLIAALEFAGLGDPRPEYSNDLMEATLAQACDRSSALNFYEVVSAYPLWRNLRATGIALAGLTVMMLLFPGLFSYSYQVYSRPTETVMPPLGYTLVPYPGDFTAIKYRDLELGAILLGDNFPDKADIYYRFTEGNWQKSAIELESLKRNLSSRGDSLTILTTVKQARRPLEYYVHAGKITTPISRVEVVDRPRITGIKVSLFYPQYTGLPPVTIDENDGNISAVVGTRANIKIETNLPVALAEMIFDDSSRAPFALNGLAAEQSLRLENDRRYIIHLVDKQGETNPDPIEYKITAIPDEYPVIEVIRPGVDINLSEDMIVPLQVRISDDYGFSSLLLKYTVFSERGQGTENVAVLHFSDRIKNQGEINFSWDLEPLNLMPSDFVQYYFELADNDRISGPKVTVSRKYIARLPSLDEIISQTEQDQGANIDRAEQFLKEQKELAERMKNVARKIDQERKGNDQKLSWQHQKELEEITAQEEKMAEELKEAAKQMEEMIKKMEENRLASRELLEKLSEIQKLFEEVATPEMKEAREKLMEALKQMDKKALEQAMKDFQVSQEEMMRRLDRTIALLKKMKIEQKINALTELAREIAQNQEEVNKTSEESSPENLPSLAPKEEKIKERFDNLKKQTQEFRQMLKEIPYNKADEADRFCKAVEQNDADSNMKEMSRELSEKDKEQSLEQGQKALSKLLRLLNELQQGQASMCKGGDDEMALKMRQTIDDINYVSGNQEELINKVSDIRGESEVLRDLAAQQQILRESAGGLVRRIEEMSKESPFMAAELNNLIRNAVGNMEYSIDKFSDRRGYEGKNFQQEALYNLNRAAVRMLDALEAQSNCNKGGSCSKPTQKLTALSEQQRQLNQQTQSMCQNPSELAQGEAMRRLAAEQEGIRKSLSQLEKEFGASKEVLGRLDAIADDMKKVVDELSSGQVGEETLERQLKVYSRMLDATRTLQRKDFTEQRKAEVGQDIFRNSPAALSGNQLKGGLDVEDKLRKFLNESYPGEYEQHIKAYFKALMDAAQNGSPVNQNIAE